MVRLNLLTACLFLHCGRIIALKPQPNTNWPPVRCASTDPPAGIQAQAKIFDTQEKDVPLGGEAISNITIITYFHVVHSFKRRHLVTQAQLDDQMRILNINYNRFGISFIPGSSDFTTKKSWAKSIIDPDLDMIPKLRLGTYRDLNIYVLTDDDTELLGKCVYPRDDQPEDPAIKQDGCLVTAGALPGGSRDNYGQGITAVHEVGHWFGLFHVFQGLSCTGGGDEIADTPPQNSPNFGCPTKPFDSCGQSPGLTNVHNFMDYSSDSCRTEFTPLQVVRMYDMYYHYRAGR